MESAQFPDNIPKFSSEKTFFKKYSYKICFKIDESSIITSDRKNLYSTKYWSNRANLRRDLKRLIVSRLPEGLDFRTREEGSNVSLFLDDDVAAQDIVKDLLPRVSEIYMPLNNEHKKLMHNNHRIRIRSKLFHSKYRYKLNIKNTWKDKFTNFDNLKIWLDTLEVDDGENRWMANTPLETVFSQSHEERSKPRYRYRFSNFAVFLNDEQDVMMLQLWLNDWYDYTEKAVLVSEI